MAQLVYLCFRDNTLSEPFSNLIDMKYDHQIKVSKPSFKLPEFEKVKQLIEICNELKRTYKKEPNGGSPQLFHLALEQLRVLNRIYENRTNWMTELLYQSGEQLYAIANKLDEIQNKLDGPEDTGDGDEEESYLIQAGRVMHMTLNICFKDRNERVDENRKIGVFYIGTLLFKLYNRIKAYGLLNNMCKVFESHFNEIGPYLSRINNDLIVIRFKFYMGLYYGYEKNNYALGFKWLQETFDICTLYESISSTYKVRSQVLIYLIPMRILHLRHYPRLAPLRRTYPSVAKIYTMLVKSLCTGNLKLYEKFIEDNEFYLVKRNLYVTVLKMKELVELKLVKKAWILNGGNTKVPLDMLAKAFQISRGTPCHVTENVAPNHDQELDELECILATLISKNYIKGYLSHSHRVMMTSKTPFPGLAKPLER